MNTLPKKKVLVALRMAGVAGHDKLAGIFRFLNNNQDQSLSKNSLLNNHGLSLDSSRGLKDDVAWDLTLIRTAAEFTPERVRSALADNYDGFIVSIPNTERTASLLASDTVPTVVMDIHDPALSARKQNIIFIRNSPEEIGRAAADFLLATGRCRTYAFIQNPAISEWSVDRFRAFRETLRDYGLWCHELASPKALAKLERPIGVLAANDDCGYDTLGWCHAHHLQVPQDAVVLGINNDTLICENCQPTLSSIQPDFEAEGFLAAQVLDQMMKENQHRCGTKTPCKEKSTRQPTTLFVGIKTIVRRDSTADVSLAGKLVQKAIAYIRAHALEGISVTDVVRHLGCSRRLADLRFRELQQTSIGEMILTCRLNEVKLLLETTREPIDSIAHICGYENPTSLKNLFKRRFGMPMRDYRAKCSAKLALSHRR